MITAILGLIGPLLLPVLSGLVSGIGINIVGLLSSGAGKVAVNVVPLAVRLALRIMEDDDHDPATLKKEAAQLIGAADPRIVAAVQKDSPPRPVEAATDGPQSVTTRKPTQRKKGTR